MKNLIFSAILLTGSAIADDLTIPNTFQAGTPARAAEVNGNFSAVEVSVDDNAQNVTDTVQALTIVTSNVNANTSNIAAVTQAVSALAGSSQYNFVGFSSGTTDATAGLFGMNAICQADYGPEARMAKSDEVAEENSIPTLTTTAAWVRPVLILAASTGSSGGFRIWDYSGYSTGSADVTCQNWSTTSGSALSIKSGGWFWTTGCNESMQVACSIPQ
jgi:hypothetical protein